MDIFLYLFPWILRQLNISLSATPTAKLKLHRDQAMPAQKDIRAHGLWAWFALDGNPDIKYELKVVLLFMVFSGQDSSPCLPQGSPAKIKRTEQRQSHMPQLAEVSKQWLCSQTSPGHLAAAAVMTGQCQHWPSNTWSFLQCEDHKLCRQGNATKREGKTPKWKWEGEREGSSRVRQVRNSSNLKG